MYVCVLCAAAHVGADHVGSESRDMCLCVYCVQQPMSAERQMVNRALARVLDMTYEMFRELGASKNELKELHQKRSIIQACYFQAISCY
ncbi:hypothetical protein BaRGS_00030853 [Batillaria attramentaria]|uniref:Uncharacterized protein n=1 Tax=Batillaria attramentaria TaxID=370345 RepID=A0ABD0JTD4_9CAEN